MAIETKKFFQACNPTGTLILSDPQQRPYYIDFTAVRNRQNSNGGPIEELLRTILNEQRSTQLFSGHIGCGKSTELRRLQYQLEEANYHVVYLDSADDLVMNDVDISDLLLTIARQVSASLAEINILPPLTGLRQKIQELWELLQMGVIPDKLDFQMGFAKLSTKLQENPDARSRLRQKLEPQADDLLRLINQELIEPGDRALQAQGKKGLVTIVDSLDRLESTQERNQAEYIFITRGQKLQQLSCHMVYTVPLVLSFSSANSIVRDRFGSDPKFLPMVPIQSRNRILNNPGILLLQDLVLARAFPDLPAPDRPQCLTEIFDEDSTCRRLCTISGGHIRSLLILLYGCLQKQDPPINRHTLEAVIATQQYSYVRSINTDEWELLRRVKVQQTVVGEAGYRSLLRSLLVFEYLDENGPWFGLNPILAEAQQLRD